MKCPVPGCIHIFNRSEDCKHHLTWKHKDWQSPLPSSDLSNATDMPSNPAIGSLDSSATIPNDSHPSPASSPRPSPPPSPPPSPVAASTPASQPRTVKIYHPHLTGDVCDSQGNLLPTDSPPDPRDITDNPWAPFDDLVAFHTADLLYRKVEMSQNDTDFLLNLWNLSLEKHNDTGPFHNHEAIHLY
ncbi:hypothetical protein VKT23_010162 [Stygiomarasmius scandens]|uniref:C2H2-type domain-containing protein n=1 Tax=Marasmiellus scandens TaxID=2682957 RepID=A0ABR1JD27_9AGAR